MKSSSVLLVSATLGFFVSGQLSGCAQDCGPAEFVDERQHVGRGRRVTVRREGGVAVAVPAQVEHRDPEAGVRERTDELVPGAAEVAHAGNGDDQRAVARDGVGEPALRPGQEPDIVAGLASVHSLTANCTSQRCQAPARTKARRPEP